MFLVKWLPSKDSGSFLLQGVTLSDALMHAKSFQSGPTLCNPMDCSPPGSSVHGILHKNTGVGCHALLQGIFLTQRLNPHLLHLLHWQAGSSLRVLPGKPCCPRGHLCSRRHKEWWAGTVTHVGGPGKYSCHMPHSPTRQTEQCSPSGGPGRSAGLCGPPACLCHTGRPPTNYTKGKSRLVEKVLYRPRGHRGQPFSPY